MYFSHSVITLPEDCADLKRRIREAAPFFDGNALDAAGFIFGYAAEEILWHEGSRTIEEYLEEREFAEFGQETQSIREGSRNSTMSHIAGKIVKRFGNTDEAYQLYMDKSRLCSPHLEQDELDRIWNSAAKFGRKVEKQEGYIPPDVYNQIQPAP